MRTNNEYYDIGKIISWCKTNSGAIAPDTEREWAKFGTAMKMLGYSMDDFIAVSLDFDRNGHAVAPVIRRRWRTWRTFGGNINTTDDALSVVVGIVKDYYPGDMADFRSDSSSTPVAVPVAVRTVRQVEQKKTILHVDTVFVNSMENDLSKTPLYNYLCTLFPSDKVREVCARYRVGGVCKDTHARSPVWLSAFPLINEHGHVVDVMLMPYGNDGHRLKEGHGLPSGMTAKSYYMAERTIVENGREVRASEHRDTLCLFGAHLVNDSDTFVVVESEKTALIGAMAVGGCWLATSSISNFNSARLKTFKDKLLVVYPDLDGRDKWAAKCEELKKEGYNVHYCGATITLLAQGAHDDIADIIARDQMRLNGL